MTPVIPMARRICAHCQGMAFRRVNRKGWWQRVLLSKLGLYPWECVHCRVRRYFRDAGQSSGSLRRPTFH